MTENQVLEIFEENHEDFIEENKDDSIMFRETWNDFIDSLLSDGEITDEQCNTWDNPF